MTRRSAVVLVLGVMALPPGCGGGPVEEPDAGDRREDAAQPTRDSGPAGCASAADCDDGLFCNGAEACDPSSASANRFGCVAGSGPCETADACLEDEDRCATPCELAPDADGDGRESIACGGDDCDDDDADRFPGNTEICDPSGRDEDCDPTTLGGSADADVDHDGFDGVACCNRQPDATLLCGTDCDDTRGGVNPGSPEACNGIDDDCNAMIDDGVQTTFYRDGDGDMFGVDGDTTMACSLPAGYAVVSGDCNDGVAGVNPGASESCDTVDNDCNGMIDDGAVAVTCYRDSDGDSFGDTGMSMGACFCPAGWVEATLPDCHDGDGSVYPMQSGWFDDAYTDPSGRDTFDYDCDGAETQRWTVAKGGPCSSLASSGSRCNGQGWATATPPACGVEADWIDCIFVELEPIQPNRCVRASSDIRRTQACH